MKRILVVSDSHGDVSTLRRIVTLHRDSMAVFHLGDGAADMAAVREEFPDLTVYQVGGNCDGLFHSYEQEQERLLSGHRVWAVHGHRYEVKSSYLRLQYAALQRGVEFALFGHTHRPFLHREEGLTLLCPGSVRDGGHYALIDITDTGVFAHLERLY